MYKKLCLYTMHCDYYANSIFCVSLKKEKKKKEKKKYERKLIERMRRENCYRHLASVYFSTSLNAACLISRLHGDGPKNAPLQLCASKHGTLTISSYLEQQFTIASTQAESGLFGFLLLSDAVEKSCCEVFALSVVVVVVVVVSIVVIDSESC